VLDPYRGFVLDTLEHCGQQRALLHVSVLAGLQVDNKAEIRVEDDQPSCR
jgi:hypothetical protein